MIAGCLRRAWQTNKQALTIIMMDLLHEAAAAPAQALPARHNSASACIPKQTPSTGTGADRLIEHKSQVTSSGRPGPGPMTTPPSVSRSSAAGASGHRVPNHNLSAAGLQPLHDVVGEVVVVIDHQDHGLGPLAPRLVALRRSDSGVTRPALKAKPKNGVVDFRRAQFARDPAEGRDAPASAWARA